MAGRIKIYAHRGARGHAPENTLLAFSLAFDLGADAIECDVQRTSDGRLVVIHDDTLDRTTNGRGKVREASFETLRGLNAGVRWNVQERIPTLDEALALVDARGGGMNLEVKAESLEEAMAIAAAVEAPLVELDDAMRERMLVSSFELPAVERLKSRLPWLRVAALFTGSNWRSEDMIARTLDLGAEALHPKLNLVTPEVMARAHAAGMRVNVWTANRWATIRGLLALGVDGVFSDVPERVVIERARFEARTTA